MSQAPRSTLLLGSLSTLLLLLPQSGHTQDNFFEALDVEVGEGVDTGPTSLLGWVSQKIGHGLQSPGPVFSRSQDEFSRIETSLFLQYDAALGDDTQLRISGKAYHDEIYRAQGEAKFSPAEINEFRNRYEVRDFYIEHETRSGLYLRAGNQVLAWGMAEYLRVSDLINPEDQYTFGQQDLEDLRLQTPALLASYSLGNWLLDGVVTVEAGRNRLAPAGDEFDQFVALRSAGFAVAIAEPEEEHEIFLRASTSLPSGDLQFVAGEFNDNALSGAGADLIDGIPIQRFGQNRSRAVAAAGNLVNGSFLFFGELGLHENKAVQPEPALLALRNGAWESRDQILGVGGVEYSGWENLLLSLEIDTIHYRGAPLLTSTSESRTGFGLRLYWTALNERLEVLGVWNELGKDAGRVGRISVEYDLSDALSLGLLWAGYDSSPTSVFYPYRNNDVVELQMRFNFQY